VWQISHEEISIVRHVCMCQITNHPWQSMRDHFLKTILTNIDDYGLNAEQKKMLQSGATGSSEECNNVTFM